MLKEEFGEYIKQIYQQGYDKGYDKGFIAGSRSLTSSNFYGNGTDINIKYAEQTCSKAIANGSVYGVDE